MTATGQTGRARGKLLAATVLLPLLLLLLGVWQAARGSGDELELVTRRDRLAATVASMAARVASGRAGMELQFRHGGQLYGGPLAATAARGELETLDTALAVSRAGRWLPPVVVLCGGAAAALSILALLGTMLLGWAGRSSRDRLVQGFGLVRRILPTLMGAQVLLMAAGVAAGVAFEALAVPEAADFSSGGFELLLFAAGAVALIVWTSSLAVLALRRTVAAFKPDPLPLFGRALRLDEAPGLWRCIDDLAARLGALRPETVVIGLTGGFSVSSGAKRLQPGGVALAGRTLYVPLPYLPLLRPDELQAIIAHELAHFCGADTEWSLRFLPIYTGVARSLNALASAGRSPVSLPAKRLGLFVMDQFHHAVRRWSRLREFAADATGAAVTSADASARALLRTAAAAPRIDDVLDAAGKAPDTAGDDLVAAVLHHACAQGLDDPAGHLKREQPHPTDSHPPTGQRLLALNRPPVAALLAECRVVPDPAARSHLPDLFAEPARLCREATADFLDAVRSQRQAYRNRLAVVATSVDGAERALCENTRGAIVLYVAALLFGGAGLALLVFPVRGLFATEQNVITGAMLAVVPVLVLLAVYWRRRGRTPFLVLQPRAMSIVALDQPIPWEHVADLDMLLNRGVLTTRVLLPPDAAFPSRRPGARGVKLDQAQRIISLKARLPPGMTAHGLAELIDRYRRAAAARTMLAEETIKP